MKLLIGSPAYRRMVGNSSWLAIASIARLGVGFATAVWLTRYLGPEGFGVYSYVVALVMILVSFGSFGMASLVTRELVEQPGARDSILGSALAIRVFGGLIATIVLVALAVLFHGDPDLRLALLVFGAVLLLQPFEVTTLFYESQTQSRFVVWVELGLAVMYAAAMLWFIFLGLSVIWFLALRLAQVALTQLGVMLVYAAQGHRPSQWRPDPRRMRSLMTEAWPLVFSAIGAVLYLRIDEVMLGQMTSTQEVGIYAAAARLSEVWYFIPTIIVASAFPYLLQIRARDRDLYSARLQQLYDLLVWLGLMMALFITAAAPWLVGALYGSDFAPSAAVLQIHVWGGIFIFVRTAFSRWLIAERLIAFSLVSQGAGAAVNVAVNLMLIPVLGGIGAAWATVLSYAVASYLAVLVFPQTRPAAVMMTRAATAPLRYLRIGATGV